MGSGQQLLAPAAMTPFGERLGLTLLLDWAATT